MNPGTSHNRARQQQQIVQNVAAAMLTSLVLGGVLYLVGGRSILDSIKEPTPTSPEPEAIHPNTQQAEENDVGEQDKAKRTRNVRPSDASARTVALNLRFAAFPNHLPYINARVVVLNNSLTISFQPRRCKWDFLTHLIGNVPTQAALNARSFWTNELAARWGGLPNVPLDRAQTRLGDESFDRIGLGRLRSVASAERCGFHGQLNIGHAVAFKPCQLPFHGSHCGTRDDSAGYQVGRGLNPTKPCTYAVFRSDVSGNRIRRHLPLHMESTHA